MMEMIETEQLQHRDALLKRLARVEGQVRGIQAMIKRGDECEAIAQQFSAARKALDKAYQEMLICLAEEAIISPEQSNQEKLVQLRAIFTKYS
jgi:DNA-binding FrmR family transcriptional regulator